MGKASKQFWDERSRKLNKKRKHKKAYTRSYSNGHKIPKSTREEYSPNYIVEVPSCFSFIDNLEETALFFGKFIDCFKKSFPKSDFLIESRIVTSVTTDAIMYLIALMRNHKEPRRRMYSFHGTYPLNEEARIVFVESGLLKFVKSKSKRLPKNNHKMSIMSGVDSDSVSAKQLCVFVADKLQMPHSYVKDLYEVIIEMMSNVFYHAYNDKEDEMIPEWYMYAEYSEGHIKFLFLDTGLGIGKTVQKHSLYEKVGNKIGFGSESKLMKSAFDGQFRTQTGEKNHGKGLPFIKEFACGEKVQEFHVLSGKGHCKFDEDGNEFIEDLKHNIAGTIYSFVIKNAEGK